MSSRGGFTLEEMALGVVVIGSPPGADWTGRSSDLQGIIRDC